MRVSLLAAATILFGPLAVTSLPAEAAEMIPAGSYIESCSDIQFDPATQVLSATCQRKSGSTPRSAELNVANCADRSIWNENGDLYCLAAAPWGEHRVVPKGSYLESCSGFGVAGNRLSATCWRGSSKTWTFDHGDQVSASLDLDGCAWGEDISNDSGVLRCAPRPLHLVPIAPIPPKLTMVPVEASEDSVPVQSRNTPSELKTLNVVPEKPPVPPGPPRRPNLRGAHKAERG